MKLENKTIIVTGSGRGIGRHMVKRLAKEGANIVVTARTEEEIDAVSNEINSAGGSAISIKGDVTQDVDVRKIITETIKKFGKVDILVNNAGVGIRKSLWETKEKEF